MSDYYYLDENKNVIPCDLLTWAEYSENNSREVDYDIVNNLRVSTVFLGLDHSYLGGSIKIFETMVFRDLTDEEFKETQEFFQKIGRKRPLSRAHTLHMKDIYCDRYSTWQEAMEGHQKAIQWVKDGCKDASL